MCTYSLYFILTCPNLRYTPPHPGEKFRHSGDSGSSILKEYVSQLFRLEIFSYKNQRVRGLRVKFRNSMSNFTISAGTGPLTEQAHQVFLSLVRLYTQRLLVCRQEEQFHLETARLSTAVDMSRNSGSFPMQCSHPMQMWCTRNGRSFQDLGRILLTYQELGNEVNTAREVFRHIGYKHLLIPDAIWEDLERRPKFVHFLVMGVKTREYLAGFHPPSAFDSLLSCPFGCTQ